MYMIHISKSIDCLINLIQLPSYRQWPGLEIVIVFLGFFLSCSVVDLTQVQIKVIKFPIFGCARLVFHKNFSTMELKYSV